jgi:tRNA modification GTPase
MDLNDTIVALASAAEPGARAVVRLSGPRALEIALSIFTPDQAIDATQRRIHPGSVRLPDIAALLASDLIVWPAPRTYTGQPMAELHTISSPPLIELLIAALLNSGARAARPGEFTMRAFLAGKRDLPRAEAVQAVIGAGSRDELKQALAQLAGGVTRPLEGLRDDLLNLLADVEAGLDFTDEDITFVDKRDLLLRLTKGMAQLTTLKRQLEQRSAGDRPFRAVLVGVPNAGKSSLFNALGGGDAALVSPEPGTTRDYLRKRLDINGVAVELIDTAGWQPGLDEIEQQAQALGYQQARDADLLLVCSDDGTFAVPGDSHGNAVRVATKCDVVAPPEGVLATSAVTGEGLAELKALLAERVRRREPALAPSLSRCRHHVDAALDSLRRAHNVALFDDPPEVLALELRGALEQLGAVTGAVHTDDMLDRIFSRFCIGK